MALLLLGAYRFVDVGDPARRRRRRRALLGVAAAVIALGGAGIAGYLHLQTLERERVDAARAAADAARRARQRELAAAFVAAAPRPEWWEAVDTPYRVDTVGDLLAAWQGYPRGELGDRQFFKAAYQGIVDHPDDEHVAATAIMLMDHVAADYPQRLDLARYGYERYFKHESRTDNCANCMPGDTTQSLAVNLSRLYSSAGRHDDAVLVCQRLIDERRADVSPYKLAETWNQMAWAHWHRGDHARALAVVREGLDRYGETVRGDELRRTLRPLSEGDDGRARAMKGGSGARSGLLCSLSEPIPHIGGIEPDGRLQDLDEWQARPPGGGRPPREHRGGLLRHQRLRGAAGLLECRRRRALCLPARRALRPAARVDEDDALHRPLFRHGPLRRRSRGAAGERGAGRRAHAHGRLRDRRRAWTRPRRRASTSTRGGAAASSRAPGSAAA